MWKRRTKQNLISIVLFVFLLILIAWGQSSSGLGGFRRIHASFVSDVLMYLYVLVFVLFMASCVLLFTGKPVFTLSLTIIIVSVLVLISKLKYMYLETKFIFSDLYFQLSFGSEFKFFFDHYRELVLILAISLLVAFVLGIIMYKVDNNKVKIKYRVILFVPSVVSASLANDLVLRPTDKRDVFFRVAYTNEHLSDFIISAFAFPAAIAAPMAIGRHVAPPALTETPAITVRPAANGIGKRPNIIVVLHESSVDPSLYVIGDQYRVDSRFFASGDEKTRRLQVKAYGGGTWISEYGFLLGLDMSYFGDRAMYLGIFSEGKFRNAFPDVLKNLGYKTIANYPSPLSFMNTGRFYRSIGFETVYSPSDMNLFIGPKQWPRDREYYNFLLNDMQAMRAAGDARPVFYFVWTTATHYPYNYPLFKDVRTDEITTGDEFAEFARRQRIAADDLLWLEGQLKSRFPDESFVVAGFGDHHPRITQPYFSRNRPEVFHPRDPNETTRTTYYRLNAIGFAPDYGALTERIEIGFLGESILGFARLPLDPASVIRQRLRQECDGKWADCALSEFLDKANAELASGPDGVFAPARR